MNFQFLGTCACDYSPRLKDVCANCFDADARRSSCALIDGTLLLDCGDHGLECLRIAGIPLSQISAVAVTHSHGDHFRPESIAQIAAAGSRRLQVFCSPTCAGLLAGIPKLSVQLCAHGVPLFWNGYTLLPLHSNHRTEFPEELTLHYLIEKDGKKLFYGLDGAWYPTCTGKRLYNEQINLFVFDATVGDYEGDIRTFEHNSLPMIRMMLKAMRKYAVFAPDAKIYLDHIAPSLYAPMTHADIAALAARDGLLVAQDGLSVSL